jgi:hypothetical protein
MGSTQKSIIVYEDILKNGKIKSNIKNSWLLIVCLYIVIELYKKLVFLLINNINNMNIMKN